MSKNATAEVELIGQMHFEGNIIPTTWFKSIRFENGKADLVSINLLSEIVYWYRPTYVRDEATGGVKQIRRKFAGTALQKSKKDLAEQFGLSERQVKDSLSRLEGMGLIKREFRTIQTEFGPMPNVQFILILPEKIREITYKNEGGYDVQTSDRGTKNGGYDVQTSEGSTFKRQNHIYNTETTTETSNSSLDEATASEEKFSSPSKSEFSEEVHEIYKTMLALMKSVKDDEYEFKKKFVNQILTCIDYMLRLDQLNKQKILDVFRWGIFDSFWADKFFKPNPAKYLREKFDQLEMKMRSNNVSTNPTRFTKSPFEQQLDEPGKPRFRAKSSMSG